MLQDAGINDVSGVQDLFKEMVSAVPENSLDEELDVEFVWVALMPLMCFVLGAVLELYLDGRMLDMKIFAKQRLDVFDYSATLTNICFVAHNVTTQCIIARTDNPDMHLTHSLRDRQMFF